MKIAFLVLLFLPVVGDFHWQIKAAKERKCLECYGEGRTLEGDAGFMKCLECDGTGKLNVARLKKREAALERELAKVRKLLRESQQ